MNIPIWKQLFKEKKSLQQLNGRTARRVISQLPSEVFWRAAISYWTLLNTGQISAEPLPGLGRNSLTFSPKIRQTHSQRESHSDLHLHPSLNLDLKSHQCGLLGKVNQPEVKSSASVFSFLGLLLISLWHQLTPQYSLNKNNFAQFLQTSFSDHGIHISSLLCEQEEREITAKIWQKKKPSSFNSD